MRGWVRPIRGRGRGAGRGDDTPDSQTAQQPNDSNTPVTPHPATGQAPGAGHRCAGRLFAGPVDRGGSAHRTTARARHHTSHLDSVELVA